MCIYTLVWNRCNMVWCSNVMSLFLERMLLVLPAIKWEDALCQRGNIFPFLSSPSWKMSALPAEKSCNFIYCKRCGRYTDKTVFMIEYVTFKCWVYQNLAKLNIFVGRSCFIRIEVFWTQQRFSAGCYRCWFHCSV